MLFKRRKPENLWQRTRVWLWPRRSFTRSVQYFLKRILRLKATPHAVAAGVAAGIFASFFPLGVHFIIAAIVSWLIAGNLVAAILATAFGNPLTFPVLWGASYETGKLILRQHPDQGATPAHLGTMLQDLSLAQLWDPVLKPMAIGAVPVGFLFGLVAYGITRWGMTTFQEQKRKRLAQRAKRDNVPFGPGNHIGPASR